jgi:16S rRNA (cytosine1402-N4)-methyltransferase
MNEMGESLPHIPVLYNEIIHVLRPRDGGLYIDGTVGAGGHAVGILEASSPSGMLLGMDLDPYALEIARSRLEPFGKQAVLVQASYDQLLQQMELLGWQKVDGVLLDLGVSSMQLDTAERGFSFMADAPLDMRFDPDSPIHASKLVNELNEQELADLLFRFGEERKSRQIARAIVRARPVKSTTQLAEVIQQAAGSRRASRGKNWQAAPGMHPATLTFQALRIAVNRELEVIEAALPIAAAALKPGGRLAVISFHSLEDRLVKQFFRRESKDCICPPRVPVCTCGHRAMLIEVNRRPIQPSLEEVQNNPRSRSARLRAVEKLPQRQADQ